MTLWRKLHEHTGLSEYEAKAYVSLVLAGPSKASDISRTCGVPRTKVYETLEKLVDRGMVARIPGKPLKFAPECPVGSFEPDLDFFEEKARDLLWAVSTLKHMYEKMKVSVKSDRAEVWIFQGRGEVLEKVQEMLSHARRFATIVASSTVLAPIYRNFKITLDEMSQKGVKITVYTSMDSYNGNVAKELHHVGEVRRTVFKFPVLLVFVDEEEFLLANLTSQATFAETGKSEQNIGIFSTNLNLHKLFSIIFRVLSP